MTTQLTLDDDVYQAVRAEAEAQGKTLSDFVSERLRLIRSIAIFQNIRR
jgi:hypothetical protein